MLVLYVYAVAWINLAFLFCAFLYKNLFVLILFLTFAIDLASLWRTGWVKTSWIVASTTVQEVAHLTSAWSTKGRFQTLSSTISNFANLLCTKKIPQQSVHVGCIILVCLLSNYWLAAHIIHNTQWRGLAKLLISVHRQCEGLIWWGKRRMFPHVFLFSILFNY